jgi:peptide/nickel transport system substrate-binding protein
MHERRELQPMIKTLSLPGLTWAAAAALSLCIGPAPAEAQSQAVRRGGTAVFSISQDPATINPAISSNVPDRQLGCIIYQGLVELSDDYRILPLLAKSWTIAPDGLTYSFNLAAAKWHDGVAFTSEDVKYSLLEFNSKYSAIFAAAGREIDSIDAPAPDRVVIKLKHPFGPFLISLGCPQGGAIMPAHLYRGTNVLTNPTSTSAPVGTGAFKFAQWRHGDFVRLVKVPDYYAEPGRPYLDALVAKVIVQPAARIQALQAGEVDLVQFPPQSSLAVIRADPKLKVVTSDVAPLSEIGFFNTTRKPLDDKRVRQALFMATNRDYLLKTVFFGIGSVGVMPFTTDIAWTSNASIDYRKMYPFDIKKANALLDEAGAKRGANGKRFSVRLAVLSSQYPELQQAAQAIKSMWQAVGVDVSIDALEDGTYFKRIYTDGDFDISFITYTTFSDPALGITRSFASASIGKMFGNAAKYSNPKVDALFVKGEQSTTPQERGVFYQQAQTILADDLPVMQLRQFKELNFASKNLMDLWGVVQGNGRWTDAWIAR